MTPEQSDLIELRFNKGMTREDIAEHYDVSIATVRRWIKELKVPRPTRAQPAKRNKNLSSSGEIIAKLSHEDGYTSIEVAHMRLQGRLIEHIGRGYFLDGRPAHIDAVLAASNEHAKMCEPN
jgi:transposase